MTLRSNDPCHCGSGKKYRHCCLNKDYSQEAPEHANAARVVLDWLQRHHRKAMSVALDVLLKELLSDDEIKQLRELDDEEALDGILINLSEWLLAEGHLLIKGEKRRVPEYVLGINGPPLTPSQRHWLTQLENNPLRLYDITDVVRGEQMTLCDVLSPDAPPVVVRERSGTQSLRPGLRLGCRLMRVDTHFEMSGAAYPFSLLASGSVGDRLMAIADEFPSQRDAAHEMGIDIMAMWLQQFVAPPPMPMMMDAYSGDPIQLVTDHYKISDWSELERAFAACKDVQGDRKSGWSRLLECEDGQVRPVVTVNIGEKANSVELFTKTLTYATQGRAWFEALAGDSARFLHRESVDPQQFMANSSGHAPAVRGKPPDMDPALLAQAIGQAIQRAYANWADEPIPLLDNKTPRQAMRTPAGLERVKGLIRSYETDEKEQAAQQGRPAVSYAFLWASIGVSA